LITYITQGLTYLMEQSPFEKLTGSQLVKKFPSLYGTQRFITMFTGTCHMYLSWARPIQSMPLHSTSFRSSL